MSDCDEGNGEPAAEEDDEEGGQSEAVVDTERQVLKEDKGELQGGKINNELKTCLYISSFGCLIILKTLGPRAAFNFKKMTGCRKLSEIQYWEGYILCKNAKFQFLNKNPTPWITNLC